MESGMDKLIVEAVRDLHARYTDAVWRKDYPTFGECFAHDAEWRIGGLERRGREQITEAFKKIMSNFRKVLITFQSPIVDVSGARPSARTYIGEQVARIDGTANISIGRYYEYFILEEDRWRFAWRLFQLHYSGPPDLSGRYFDWEDYGAPPGMPPLDAPSGAFAAE
jgi:uncharacterized protein (TIGR02246 family)